MKQAIYVDLQQHFCIVHFYVPLHGCFSKVSQFFLFKYVPEAGILNIFFSSFRVARFLFFLCVICAIRGGQHISFSTVFQLYITLTTEEVLLDVDKSSRIIWYYLMAYGVSFTIVAISLAIDPGSYTQADFCLWTESNYLFYFTFVSPVFIYLSVCFHFFF